MYSPIIKRPFQPYRSALPAAKTDAQDQAQQSIGRIKSLQQEAPGQGDWSGYAQAAQQESQQAQARQPQPAAWAQGSQQPDPAQEQRQRERNRLINLDQALNSGLSREWKRNRLIVIGYSPEEAERILGPSPT